VSRDTTSNVTAIYDIKIIISLSLPEKVVLLYFINNIYISKRNCGILCTLSS